MRRGDDGYALVAAVAAVAVFALTAFEVLAGDQGDVAEVRGRTERAQLEAAADAGVALAIHALADDDPNTRWPLDGSSRQLDFAGDQLSVSVQDERGKVALAALSDTQARVMFATAGASGDQLDALVDEFHRWTEAEDATAPPMDDAKRGYASRHGPFRTVGELSALKDMNPATFARIAPAATTFFERSGGFESHNAQPLATAVMQADDASGLGDAAAAPTITTQRPAQAIDDDTELGGRTLTVTAVARGPDGARAHRTVIVELTGDTARPFWIRYTE